MKKITYKERATFYIQEVKKDYKKIKLLKAIKDKYDITSMALCPCASGVYLRECSEIFKESYSYSVTKYIVLELFDFNLGKTLTYYDSKIEDNKFYFSKQFTFNDLNIKRYNKHIHYKTHIEFWYQYFNKDNLVFETNFKLYNYEYNMIKKIVDKSNKFVIQEKNEAENGTYIIVLKRISNKK